MLRPLRLVLLTSLWALSAPAFAAESIVLMPLELTGGLEANRADIESAVNKGLAVAGRPVIPPDETGARGTYVVSGTVGREGSAFTARFQIVRAADSYEIGTQQNHCDVADCSVADLARRSARELVRQTLGRSTEPARPEPPPLKAPLPDTTSSRPTLLGAGAIALGAAAIGAGVYLVAIDGRCTTSVQPMHACKYFNETKAGGIASIAGGALVGALGVYLLVRDDGKSAVAVGLRPDGVSLAGRF